MKFVMTSLAVILKLIEKPPPPIHTKSNYLAVLGGNFMTFHQDSDEWHKYFPLCDQTLMT